MMHTQAGTQSVIDSSSKTDERKLDHLANVEIEPLYMMKTIFPFDLFPDTVTIYRNKLTIIEKSFFFFIRNTTNIPIANINYVRVLTAFPFATLEISDRYFSEQPILVNKLRISDAQKAMAIIEGLRLAVEQNIDTSRIPRDNLLEGIQRIGLHEDN